MPKMYNPDYKIEIRFTIDGNIYYDVFRKDQPYNMKLGDFKELSFVFNHLSYVVDQYVREEMEKESILKKRAFLREMSREDASVLLSENAKRMWVDIHNETGKYYRYCENGDIVFVPDGV